MKIEVCQRLCDHRIDWATNSYHPRWHAQIEGQPGLWAAGDTIDDAIGNLIRTHPEKFGIQIKILEGKQPR